MNFVVIKSNIKESLNISERGISDNDNNLPVLKNVLIKADGGNIDFISTNLEIAVTCRTSGKIIEKGAIAAPLKALNGIISNIPNERINIESKGNKLTIKSDNYEAVLDCVPEDDFPITPKLKKESGYIEISSDELIKSVSGVLNASQFSDLRPELNGVLFKLEINNDLKIAATDSFRLAEKTIPFDKINTNHKEDIEFIMPLKTAYEAIRAVKSGGVVRIYSDENQIILKTDNIEIFSRILEGKFPDYKHIIPNKFKSEITVKKDDFMSAIKLSGVFSGKSGEIKLEAKTPKFLKISSSDQAIGENTYNLPAKVDGKVEGISFNWRYLLDAIKSLDGEDVFLGINEDNEPSLIRSAKDMSYSYILKPVVSV
ncbi:MAG: DNA polymerase III subunit beta [bacterium]|nr:DNA polymerase III subunit beta [bacterium]